jgi:hypothetical protein
MDFGELWAQRQKADTIAAVDKYSSPVEGTKAISFESEYSRKCGFRHRHVTLVPLPEAPVV